MKDALKPTVLSDGTLLGEAHRNALRKDVNDLLQEYYLRRFENDIKNNPGALDRYKDVCVDAAGCLTPTTVPERP